MRLAIRPLSALVLAVVGLSLIGIGIYFLCFRPALLPEDLRFMRTSIGQVETHLPGLLQWLKHVFWVMGGYIVASGILMVHVAITGFRHRERGAAVTVVFAGTASIGVMSAVNFMLASDFKWLLFVLASLWIVALALYFFENSKDRL